MTPEWAIISGIGGISISALAIAVSLIVRMLDGATQRGRQEAEHARLRQDFDELRIYIRGSAGQGGAIHSIRDTLQVHMGQFELKLEELQRSVNEVSLTLARNGINGKSIKQ